MAATFVAAAAEAEQSGQLQAAADAYLRAHSLEPLDPAHLVGAAEVYVSMGKDAEARMLFERVEHLRASETHLDHALKPLDPAQLSMAWCRGGVNEQGLYHRVASLRSQEDRLLDQLLMLRLQR